MFNQEIVLTKGDVPHITTEPITGNVVITATSAVSVKSVELKIKGKVETKWTEGKDNHRSYSDTVLKQKITLWTPPEGSEEMAAGTYNFPFSFEITSESKIPPSFEMENGSIRYFLTSKICCFSDKLTDKKKIPIKILPKISVNESVYNEPIKISGSMTLCCCCCADGPIEYEFKAPRKAYAPGDHMEFKAHINNKMSKIINGFVIELREEIKYYVGSYICKVVMFENRIELATESESIPPNTEYSKTFNIVIPQVGPSFGIEVGKVIMKACWVDVHIKIHESLILFVPSSPVIIGTIPFNGPTAASSSSSSSAANEKAEIAAAMETSGDVALPATQDDNSEPEYHTKDENVY